MTFRCTSSISTWHWVQKCRAPAGLSAAALRERGLTAIPPYGIEAVTLPGEDTWGEIASGLSFVAAWTEFFGDPLDILGIRAPCKQKLRHQLAGLYYPLG